MDLEKWEIFMLEILNRADGKEDLITIAERRGLQILDYVDLTRDLIAAGYIYET